MSNFTKLFDLEAVKTVKSKTPVTLITASLFPLDNGYKPFQEYRQGLDLILNKLTRNIVLRLYYQNIDDELLNLLESHPFVELYEFKTYNLADPNTGSLGIFGALLRYLPLFYNIPNVEYVMVMDLDINKAAINEFFEYLNSPICMKSHDFTYSCRTWYKSGHYWYDQMANDSFFHMVRGWGMGFRTGLLHPAILLNFISQCSLPLDQVDDEQIYKFKKLSAAGCSMNTYSKERSMSYKYCNTFPYGIVELFTTFYILQEMLMTKYKIMRINVQYGILPCLAQDLMAYISPKQRDILMQNANGISFNEFVQEMKKVYINGNPKIQTLWRNFLDHVHSLIQNRSLNVNHELWCHIVKHNSVIIYKKNNKTVLSRVDKQSLMTAIFGPC